MDKPELGGGLAADYHDFERTNDDRKLTTPSASQQHLASSGQKKTRSPKKQSDGSKVRIGVA